MYTEMDVKCAHFAMQYIINWMYTYCLMKCTLPSSLGVVNGNFKWRKFDASFLTIFGVELGDYVTELEKHSNKMKRYANKVSEVVSQPAAILMVNSVQFYINLSITIGNAFVQYEHVICITKYLNKKTSGCNTNISGCIFLNFFLGSY